TSDECMTDEGELLESVGAHPIPEGSIHGNYPLLFALPYNTGQHVSREKWEQAALRSFSVVISGQAKKLEDAAIVPPDLRNLQAGVNREFVQRGMCAVNFHNQIRWRVGCRVNRVSTGNPLGVLNVVAFVRLRASDSFREPERRGTQTY